MYTSPNSKKAILLLDGDRHKHQTLETSKTGFFKTKGCDPNVLCQDFADGSCKVYLQLLLAQCTVNLNYLIATNKMATLAQFGSNFQMIIRRQSKCIAISCYPRKNHIVCFQLFLLILSFTY